jgi:hypothetical protein
MTDTPNLKNPRIVMMATDNIDTSSAPLLWSVGEVHPLASSVRVVAMFMEEDVVEIYSSNGTNAGIRDLVPLTRVRIIREAMAFDVFAKELGQAELGEDYEDDDDIPEEDDPPEPQASTNRQATP